MRQFGGVVAYLVASVGVVVVIAKDAASDDLVDAHVL